MPAKNCNNCSYCKSIAAVEVTGDELAIKREFERIERNQKISDLGDMLEAIDYLKDKQAKSPSTDIDGL
ncbi:hypothetical protein [Psychrobacter aquaticus]|uniref:Uncharacterized protein n=1 Tax=Psychrobacter aquaticus CMS 56 TaxID=1354303 RepID=U4T8C3_9GAMM|nr:hypothetical protein [Psychrobacter aquaticus]ERL54974.1 hypothetical protein M917_2320 [Psychrobacter aquaticus CMS 56]